MTNIFHISFWKKKAGSVRDLLSYKLSLYKAKQRKQAASRQAQKQSQEGIFPVEIKNHLGIGAKIIWCVEILLYCKEYKLSPYFKFSYADSEENDDYFGAFFQSEDPGKKINYISIHTIGDLGLPKNYNKELNVGLSNQLIRDFIIPKKEISDEAETFFRQTLKGEATLGIHFRNTDKKSEAPPVSYGNTLLNIKHCLEQNPHLKRIFITTDDKAYVEFMKNSHLSSIIFFREDSFRSADGKAIHENNSLNKYDINKDAVINMLILTKCSFIIKTASILSSCSLLFNPSIPFIMLNKPYDKKLWFPESELIKKTAYEALSGE